MDPLSFSINLLPIEDGVYPDNVIREKKFLGIGQDYTKSLIDLLVAQGYTEGADLFTFPYDWRYGVTGVNEDGEAVNIKALDGQINYILNQTDAGRNAGRVDVVAHSTGGLLVKKYVMEHPDNHGIGKAVFVGVPNLGAPKAIKVLLQGDNFNVYGLSDAEMKKLSRNMPVVYDLAPSRAYVDRAGSFFKIDDQELDYQDAVDELLGFDINSKAWENSENLHSAEFEDYDLRDNDIDVYNIVGCKAATFDQIQKRTFEKKGIWVTKLVSGDGTVPFESANSIAAKDNQKFYAINASHGTMLSADGTRQQIVNLLTGSNLSVGNSIIDRQELLLNPTDCAMPKGKKIKILSPLNIAVTTGAGEYLGFAQDGSVQNDIPGADFEVFDDHKFVFLPENNSEYIISLQGTGEGTFTLVSETVDSDGSVLATETFSEVPVTTVLSGAVLVENGQTILSLDEDGDGSIDEELISDEAKADTEQDAEETNSDSGIDEQPTPEPQTSSNSGGARGPAPTGIIDTPTPGKILGAQTIAPGTLVLDMADNRTVYMIGHDNKKYGFATEKSFLGFGFKFSNIQSMDLTGIESGEIILDSNRVHPDGSLVIDGKTIWLVRNGKLFGIPNMEIFANHGWELKNVVPINQFDQQLPVELLN